MVSSYIENTTKYKYKISYLDKCGIKNDMETEAYSEKQAIFLFRKLHKNEEILNMVEI